MESPSKQNKHSLDIEFILLQNVWAVLQCHAALFFIGHVESNGEPCSKF